MSHKRIQWWQRSAVCLTCRTHTHAYLAWRDASISFWLDYRSSTHNQHTLSGVWPSDSECFLNYFPFLQRLQKIPQTGFLRHMPFLFEVIFLRTFLLPIFFPSVIAACISDCGDSHIQPVNRAREKWHGCAIFLAFLNGHWLQHIRFEFFFFSCRLAFISPFSLCERCWNGRVNCGLSMKALEDQAAEIIHVIKIMMSSCLKHTLQASSMLWETKMAEW